MDERGPVYAKGMSIEEIGEAANLYIAAEWEPLYERMHEQLSAAFKEIEDAAYGRYLDQLMPPVFIGLEKAGYQVRTDVKEGDFVIGMCLKFSDSLEKWGAEDNRSRLFWNVIANERAEETGTLLTEIPHSHLGFNIPAAPRLHTLRDTAKDRIHEAMHRLMKQ